MFLVVNKFARTLLLITVVFTATFLMPRPTSATAVCVCYFGDVNDCEPTAVSDAAMDGECKKACETLRGSGLKTYKYASTAILGGGIIAECSAAHSVATKEEPVQAIYPKLSVDIPGVTFSPIKKIGGELHVNFLQDYIGGVYKYLLTFSTLAAIVLLIVAGLQYVIGAASQPQIASSKKRILNAVTGLVLLLSVAMILETVNPQLTSFMTPLRVRFVPKMAGGMTFAEFDQVKPEPGSSSGTATGLKSVIVSTAAHPDYSSMIKAFDALVAETPDTGKKDSSNPFRKKWAGNCNIFAYEIAKHAGAPKIKSAALGTGSAPTVKYTDGSPAWRGLTLPQLVQQPELKPGMIIHVAVMYDLPKYNNDDLHHYYTYAGKDGSGKAILLDSLTRAAPATAAQANMNGWFKKAWTHITTLPETEWSKSEKNIKPYFGDKQPPKDAHRVRAVYDPW